MRIIEQSHSTRQRRYFAAWALTALALLAVALLPLGCAAPAEGKADESKTESRAGDQENAEDNEVLIPIHASYPVSKDISSYFETTTRVQAETRVEVVAKGIGQCMDVYAEEGDKVKAGQVLAELEAEELEAQIRQTRVQVEQQKASYEIAQRSLEEGIGSKVERDNARFAYEQALATLKIQQVKLDQQIIRAPISGIVTQKNIQTGMMVSSGMPTFSIVDPSSYILPINPPEKELPNLHVGQKAKVTIDAYKDKEFEATVRQIYPSVDPTSGTVRVILDIPDDNRDELREAAFARVKLVMDTHEDALVVPKDALLEENARDYLMVVRKEGDTNAEIKAARAETDTAESARDTATTRQSASPQEGGKQIKGDLYAKRVEVETGLEDSESVEITKGIGPETLVVTLGQHTLKPGAKVVITNAKDLILSRSHMSTDEALAAAKDRQSQDGGPNQNHREIMFRR